MTNDEIIDEIIEREGGYTDRKEDAGGPTNFGVTQETLSNWRHLPLTYKDVQALTKDEARTILMQKYVIAPGFDDIPYSELKHLVIDMWVNHGPKNATLIIQKAVGLPGDGIMGKQTLAAITTQATPDTFTKIIAERVRFYGKIIKNKPSQAVFAAGWLDRAADFIWEN